MQTKKAAVISLILSFATCVFGLCQCSKEATKASSSNEVTPTPAVEAKTTEASDKSTQALLFKGFVPTAFDVTVDGVAYTDLEDFYTQELARLPERVKEAGYSTDYDITFDAAIGFSDLWADMSVYIVSETDRGYFGEGLVDQKGGFKISLPEGDGLGSYKVRANKRINIILTKDKEVTKICYNFSALDKAVSFDENEKPIILTDFVSKITSYACPNAKSDGLTIPVTLPASQTAVKFELGQSKREVLTSFGSENLLIQSQTQWCYTYDENYAKNKYCAVNNLTSCPCSVTFTDEGKLSSVENIAVDYLGESLIY